MATHSEAGSEQPQWTTTMRIWKTFGKPDVSTTTSLENALNTNACRRAPPRVGAGGAAEDGRRGAEREGGGGDRERERARA